jgi:hypothetical protein
MSTFTPGPVHLATIDRQTVRGLVDVEGEYLKSIAVAGGNVHQTALDRQDAIQIFTSTLSPDESLKFYELYNQEIAAATQAANDKLLAANTAVSVQLSQRVQDASNFSTWVSIIAFFVILISAISIVKN